MMEHGVTLVAIAVVVAAVLFIGTFDIFLMLPEYMKPPKESTQLMIGIMSARENFEHRNTLRNTWLKHITSQPVMGNVSYRFVVGANPCNVHPANRKSEYECEELRLSPLTAQDNDIRECTELTVLEDLNGKAREKLNHLRTKIEELEKLGKEQDRVEDKQVILKNVDNHKQRLTSNVTSLRKTNLSVKLAIDKLEKEALLTGGTTKRNINTKETLAKTATSITESLMELNQTMDAQVKKGNLTLTALESSSKTISDTHEEFKSMGGHIQNAKKLLTKYGHRELTDKLLIFIALVFFFATVIYILKRRIWS